MRIWLIAALALAASTGNVALANEDPSLAGKPFAIVSLGGMILETNPDRPATFEVDAEGKRYAATVGCNRMAGSVTIEAGGKLSFGPGISTKMACPPPLNEYETRLASVLEQVRGYSLEGGSLVLVDETNTAIAEFSAR